MSILVSYSMPHFGCPFVMRILKMDRHGGFHRAHCFHGLVHGQISCIALRRTGYISDCLSQGNPRFRHAKAFYGLSCRYRYLQCLRVCISHILCRTNHNSAGNKFNVFPCVQHFSKVKYRCIRVRAPHTFNKSRNGVIMVVPCLVVAHHPFLNTLRRCFQIDMDFPVFALFRG